MIRVLLFMGETLEIHCKNKLDIPAFNTAAGQRSFIYQAVKCWNTLPEEIIKCESLHSFKSKAKGHFYTVFK